VCRRRCRRRLRPARLVRSGGRSIDRTSSVRVPAFPCLLVRRTIGRAGDANRQSGLIWLRCGWPNLGYNLAHCRRAAGCGAIAREYASLECAIRLRPRTMRRAGNRPRLATAPGESLRPGRSAVENGYRSGADGQGLLRSAFDRRTLEPNWLSPDRDALAGKKISSTMTRVRCAFRRTENLG
jgi:hypothetical protein